jgi:UDP-N-acetylmuramyl tripeptide synthase
VLWRAGVAHDLGAPDEMPLTVGGRARYNIANLAAAALAAVGLGVEPTTVAAVFACFGAQLADNPGRLMRFEHHGAQVLVDYAHNPDGLRGLLEVAHGLLGDGGRLGLVLGHAGNREDRDIERLAATAAGFRPSLVVLKELDEYRRGRQPGEVPRILRRALLHAGMADAALQEQATELEAAAEALHWARRGDVIVLPVHGLAARKAVVELLQRRPP